MRGSAAVFIIGMVAAAVVGIAVAFAMPQVIGERTQEARTADNTDVIVGVVNGKLDALDQSVQVRIDELTASVDALGSQLQDIRKDMRGIRAQAPVAAAGSAPLAEGQAVAPNIDSVINRVLDDRDKRREDEREQERTQRATEMRERFKGMMTSRVERYAGEKGWDAAKTEQVKQIMSDYMDKMGELGGGMMSGRRRGGPQSEESRAQMTQLMEEAKTNLLGVVTEEEANELLRSAMGGSRGRGDRGNRGSQQGSPGGR